LEIEDLEEGMELEWVIRNVTDFWAFVDIGLHSDGLVHKSQMANFFVKNPTDVVAVWQQVKVKVVNIDLEREKVWLSMKDCDNSSIITQKQEDWQRAYKQEARKQQREENQSRDNSDSESSIWWNITIWWNISFS
jgi:transcriptional accessory protein Tex/SPT6